MPLDTAPRHPRRAPLPVHRSENLSQGHWIAGQTCTKYYLPCAVGLSNCIREDQGESEIQPCDWKNQPDLLGTLVETLPQGATDLQEYPYTCPKGVYGSTDPADQSGPLCAGACPPGRVCASTATTEPAACPVGHYCEEGSAEPIPCPAGSYGAVENLTSSAGEPPSVEIEPAEPTAEPPPKAAGGEVFWACRPG